MKRKPLFKVGEVVWAPRENSQVRAQIVGIITEKSNHPILFSYVAEYTKTFFSEIHGAHVHRAVWAENFLKKSVDKL